MPSRLNRYILASVARPIIILLGIAMLALVLEELIRLINAVVIEQGPPSAMWRMLLYLLPEYLAQAVQISFFLGVLMGFQRLKQDNALAALYAGGVSLRRLASPALALGAVLAATYLLLAGVLQPLGAYEFEKTGFLVKNGAYGFPIKAGEIMQLDAHTMLRVGGADRRTGNLERIFIQECKSDGACTATTARVGKLEQAPSTGDSTLVLGSGRQIRLGPEHTPSGAIDFKTMSFPAHLRLSLDFRARGELAKESTLTRLWRVAYQRATEDPAQADEYKARLHAIVINSLAFLAFGAFGAALGAGGGQRRRNFGAPLALVFYVLFVQGLNAGEMRVVSGASPWLLMWPALAALFAAGLIMFLRESENVGVFPRVEPGDAASKSDEGIFVEAAAAGLRR